MLTRKVLRTVIGSDGIENPDHDPRISISYGLGRWSALAMPAPISTTRMPTPIQTNRCRHRLRTRAMAGGAGRGAGMDRPGPGGACGSDAMPVDAPPMIAPRTSPFVLVRRYGEPHLPPGEGTSCDVGLPVFSGCCCSR